MAPAVLNELAEGLTPLTALGFMYELTEITDSLVKDVRNHVVPAERLRVVFDAEEPVAFIASALKQTDYGNLYELEGIIIHPNLQGKKLGRKLLTEELRQTNSTLLGFQTQNQRMADLGSGVAEYDADLTMELAPLIGTPNPQVRMNDLGGEILIHERRYRGESLYHDMDSFVRERKLISGLDTTAGDALVFIGRIKENL